MKTLTPDEYFAFLRNDFSAFIEGGFRQLNPDAEFLRNWHIEIIASELEQCLRGETKRLIINGRCTSLANVFRRRKLSAEVRNQGLGASCASPKYRRSVGE